MKFDPRSVLQLEQLKKQPEFFFRLLFQLLKFIAHCEDEISLMFHLRFTYMLFLYSYIYFHYHQIYRVCHYHRVYHELAIDYLSMWLGTTTGLLVKFRILKMTKTNENESNNTLYLLKSHHYHVV